ncbi:MAG: glycoside hydrolase family 20 zincin-like fold domain-containing protein [Phycisphaeraceae bacterium]
MSNATDPLAAPLIPSPRECRFAQAGFTIGSHGRLHQPVDASPADRAAADALAKLLKTHTGVRPRRGRTTRYIQHHVLFVGVSDDFTLPPGWLPEASESYAIEVTPRGVLLVGRDEAGLFYAVQTFGQILQLRRRGGRSVPAMTIRDWPAMRWRAVMIDVGRQVERVDHLDHMIRELAGYRKNMFVLYFEDKFRWRSRPKLAHPLGYTPDQFRQLAETATDHHVQFVPAMASLGHCEGLLRHPSLARLRAEGAIYQLSLRHRGTRKLLRDLYGELLPLYAGRFFHVNCDESPLLGGPPQPRAAAKRYFRESLRLFREHLLFLHDLCAEQGKRIMMWGDMLLHYPQLLDGLPRDIVIVDWDYGPMRDKPREAPRWFVEHGFEVIVAPAAGRSAAVGVMPHMQMADNVPAFIAAGHDAGAVGEMTTMWEMNTTNPLVLWPGLVASAQCAWNPPTTNPAKVPEHIASHLYGKPAAASVVEAWRKLSGDAFMSRFRQEHGGREVAGYRTYHTDSHEIVVTDPLVYLTYRADAWSTRVADDAAEGLAHLRAAAGQATGGHASIEAFAAGGRLQQYQGELRRLVNVAGNHALSAERARRVGQLDEAAAQLGQAGAALQDLAALAKQLLAIVPRIWRQTRYSHDPALHDTYLRRLRLARQTLAGHITRLQRAERQLAAGRDVTLGDIVGGQNVLFYDAYNPSPTLVDIWQQHIEASDDGETWQSILTKGWFALTRQHYALAQMLAHGRLPQRIRLTTRRTHIDPRRHALDARLRIRVARTLTPADVLDGRDKADFETCDARLQFRDDVAYRCVKRAGLVMEYHRT